MLNAVIVICGTVIFCTLVICGSWIRVELIRKQGE